MFVTSLTIDSLFYFGQSWELWKMKPFECCICVASRYSFIKDANEWVWRVKRVVEDVNRGCMGRCFWWPRDLSFTDLESRNSGGSLESHGFMLQFCCLWLADQTCWSLQYTVFDQLKQHLLKQKTAKAENTSSPVVLSAFMAFLLGAVSKSVATVITYPAIRY